LISSSFYILFCVCKTYIPGKWVVSSSSPPTPQGLKINGCFTLISKREGYLLPFEGSCLLANTITYYCLNISPYKLGVCLLLNRPILRHADRFKFPMTNECKVVWSCLGVASGVNLNGHVVMTIYTVDRKKSTVYFLYQGQDRYVKGVVCLTCLGSLIVLVHTSWQRS